MVHKTRQVRSSRLKAKNSQSILLQEGLTSRSIMQGLIFSFLQRLAWMGGCVCPQILMESCAQSVIFSFLTGVQESDRRIMERPERCRYPTSSLVKKTVRQYEDWDTELYRWPGDKKVIEDRDGEVRIFDLQRWCNFSTYPNARRSRWLTGDAIVAYLKLFRNPKGTVVNTFHFTCFQRGG